MSLSMSMIVNVLLSLNVLVGIVSGRAYITSKKAYLTATSDVVITAATGIPSLSTILPKYEKTAGTLTPLATFSKTVTLKTLTDVRTVCIATGILTGPIYRTIYTEALHDNKAMAAKKASICFNPTWFNQTTLTGTKEHGKTYTVMTVTGTKSVRCGSVAVNTTSILTHDNRCQPSALTSAYSGWGLEYGNDVPLGGAVYSTTTKDASSCCQLCAETSDCSASSWDIRTDKCKLEFAVDFESGKLICGEGLLAFYNSGPVSPMVPGTGLWVAAMCGNVEFGAAKPDDGS